MKARQHRDKLAFLTPVVLAAGAGFLPFIFCDLMGFPAQAAGETLRGMLAAQIRMQGVSCDKPLSAVTDAKRSRPDHDVWVLKCSNATYRISRFPDMAAKVERVR
jgi:hypothetical protein